MILRVCEERNHFACGQCLAMSVRIYITPIIKRNAFNCIHSFFVVPSLNQALSEV